MRKLKSSKGISLPIEIIVIIAIAVFVLVMLFALFSGPTFSFQEKIDAQSNWGTACNLWKSQGCDTSSSALATGVPGYTYKGAAGTIGNICSVLGYSTSSGREVTGTCAANCCGFTG